ncbi:MAG: transglutaminase family protein [Inhella sp.]|jgi:transglutaminase-like putative cysteine protease|nr:transglutaminase family protein [Inhella sp.]
MFLHIHHTTRYAYEAPLRLSTQVLRLTPRPTPGLQVQRWALDLPGRAVPFPDTWGNAAHVLTLDGARREILLRADGAVLTPDGPATPEPDDALPPEVFLRATPLTEPDAAIAAFAEPLRARLAGDPHGGLVELAAALLQRMPYIPGGTDAATAAPQAFANGHGVCQDHAQVFIACLRLLGLPARYVSGYLATDAEHVASHAWAEVRLPEGWLGFDVSNSCFADGHHVRLAYGADYLDACPVRGMRVGGGLEQLATFVRITQDQ